MKKPKLLDNCSTCSEMRVKFDALAVELDVLKYACLSAAEELVSKEKPGLLGKEKQDWVKAVLVSLLQDAKTKLNEASQGGKKNVIQ